MSGKGGRRDYARLRYDNVGLPRGPVVDFLLAEAASRGVPYATHLRDLLVDRVQALTGQGGTGMWFPRGLAVPGAQANPREETEQAVGESSGGKGVLEEEEIEENLDAFLDGFLDEEEIGISDAPTEPSLPAVAAPR